MRLSCLLLLGLMPMFLHYRSGASLHPAQRLSYDSLGKYSYLLIVARASMPYGSATGFFYRKKDRLFLIGAYHTLSSCPMYRTGTPQQRADSVQVWYTDTLGRYTFKLLPLGRSIADSCKTILQKPDMDTMDVTGLFMDGQIFSIEGMVHTSVRPLDDIRSGDTVICLGFPGTVVEKFLKGRKRSKPPVSGRTCFVINMPDDFEPLAYKKIDSMYLAIRPGLVRGFSGAPLFRIKSDGQIEFAGIQSGTQDGEDHSLVTKEYSLNGLLLPD